MLSTTCNQFSLPRRRLRLGMVGGGGAGLIGQIHANGARLSNRWEVVAGALSSDPARAKAAGAEWLIAPDRSYPSFTQMAEHESSREDGIDAVTIAVPNDLHFAVAKTFMDKGIHVICDKPLTRTVEEARALVAITDASGIVFGVTYPYAGHTMVKQLRQMVIAGEIGNITQIHTEFLQEWAIPDVNHLHPGAKWRIDPEKSGPSFTLLDIGTHAFHLTEFAASDQIEQIQANFHVCGSPKPLEDTCFINFRMKRGAVGTMIVSQAAAGTHCGLRIRVFGDKGSLAWDQEAPEHLHFGSLNRPGILLTRGYGAGIADAAEKYMRMPRGMPEGLTDAWANIYSDFALAIEPFDRKSCQEGSQREYPDVRDGARGVSLVDAAVRSSHSGGTWQPCETFM